MAAKTSVFRKLLRDQLILLPCGETVAFLNARTIELLNLLGAMLYFCAAATVPSLPRHSPIPFLNLAPALRVTARFCRP
jgi:hypothetical protein